ncbi:MAG: NAD-dependent deacylase [Candidatus Eisenbacteria sp.]|nr:NAD-dependent deacylase [Candidatus Eisenbacteria bacterium]
MIRARQLVGQASRMVAFTGAGISAESGIPTYRDAENSLWKAYDPQKTVQIDFFLRDPAPFWRFFRDLRYKAISAAKPNPGHLALAEMERAGKLSAIITQNIDGLHQAAGSQRVIELHGNTRRIGCLNCSGSFTMETVYQLLEKELPPRCPECGGMLKPKVVFFGEALPQEALMDAARYSTTCDLLIAVGSSLQVYPAAALPERARASGAKLIIINKTPTPFDYLADALLHQAAGEVLPVLAEGGEVDTDLGRTMPGEPEAGIGT